MVTFTPDPSGVVLLAGTLEGLYLFAAGPDRREWTRSGPHLAEFDVSHAILDPRDGQTIYAAVTGAGITGIYRSRDFGRTWEMAADPFPVDQVWHVQPGHASQPGRLYAGVQPAAIYRSDDGGDSWEPLPGLNGHPTREDWWEGGAGGIYLHTVLVHPTRADRLYAGISVAGMFRSDDSGQTWQPQNGGVQNVAGEAGINVRHPEVHRCVHKAVLHPHRPEILFQQNHTGVYRSDDGGQSWVDISEGLPSRLGFPVAISREPNPAVYVVPQDSEQIRLVGQLSVYRTRDGGRTWEACANGLPTVDELTIYREGMAADHFDPAGIYFGTSDGHIWYSTDGGDAWKCLTEGLSKVRSITCGVPIAD